MENSTPSYWKKCSSCKSEIPFEGSYFVCSVSTCNSKKMGLAFCSIGCWDAHLGFANHRSAADAIEEIAPTREAFATQLPQPTAGADRSPQRRLIRPITGQDETSTSENSETLVVVSKIKKLIRDKSEMDFHTSQCCIDALSEKLAEICLKAIENARTAGRKTVMGRDIP